MADEAKPYRDMKEEKKKIESSPNTVDSLKKKKDEEKAENREEKPPKILKKEEKKTEAKPEKEEKKKPQKIKKTEVFARGVNIPVSTKDAVAVCRFIKNKRIGDALRELEQIRKGKKAVPMKGEIPHRKGKGMMSGRFPKKTAEHFIIILKGLAANANIGDMEEPIITEAMANFASRPYGRFGRTQKKRTHIKIIAREKTQKRTANANTKPHNDLHKEKARKEANQ